MNAEKESMGWLAFADKMRSAACQLSGSNCPMVFVMPDGSAVRLRDAEVEVVPVNEKQGSILGQSFEYHIKISGSEDGGYDNATKERCPAKPMTLDAAKMREALEDAKAFLLKHGCDCSEGAAVVSRIDFALAAPPRTCDVGTAEQQAERFTDFCRKQGEKCAIGRGKGECPIFKGYKYDCGVLWSQMPYEEGGAKLCLIG